MPQPSPSTTPSVSRKSAIDRVTQMMAIPGKSCQEKQVVEFITKELLEAGVNPADIQTDATPKQSPAGGEVGNLIVKLKGTLRGPRRLLMAHIDTVPLCVGSRPVRRGGEIVAKDPHTALGADNRAGASVVLTAILEILRQNLPHPPLTLFWPVQEEIGLLGARYVRLSKLGDPEAVFQLGRQFPGNRDDRGHGRLCDSH